MLPTSQEKRNITQYRGKVCLDFGEMALREDLEALRPSLTDLRVITSDGTTIAAHSSVLVSNPGLSLTSLVVKFGWMHDRRSGANFI